MIRWLAMQCAVDYRGAAASDHDPIADFRTDDHLVPTPVDHFHGGPTVRARAKANDAVTDGSKVVMAVTVR
jgi:hypothetical protein